jgi:hypothetical protein
MENMLNFTTIVMFGVPGVTITPSRAASLRARLSLSLIVNM